MEQFKFHEVVIGIIVGDITEGTEFTTTSGFKVVYKNGVLSWVTSGGYVGTPVAVTSETLEEIFTVVNPVVEKQITFQEAIGFIADGDTVRIDMNYKEYEVSTLDQLEELIEEKEFLSDLYAAPCYVNTVEAVELPFADEPFSDSSKATEYLVAHDVPVEESNSEVSGKKLDASDAYSVLFDYHISGCPVVELADRYNVSTRMIYYILDGTHWADVNARFISIYQDYKG